MRAEFDIYFYIPPALFSEVPVPDQKFELSCICVIGIDFACVCSIFKVDVGNVWYLLFLNP